MIDKTKVEEGIYKYKANGRVYFYVHVRPRSPDQSFRVNRSKSMVENIQTARRVKKKLLVEAHQEIHSRISASSSWDQLVEDWTLAARHGDVFIKSISSRTVDDYYSLLKKFTIDWAGVPANTISKGCVWRLFELVEREHSLERRKKLRTAFDAVFKWGLLTERIKGISTVPSQGYSSTVKKEEKKPEILTLDEIKLLLKRARELNHPWASIWTGALCTGMRSGELYALEWKCIDFDKEIIYVHRNWTSKDGFKPTKARYWRTVPIDNPVILDFFHELKIANEGSKFVFPRYNSWKAGRGAEELRKFCVGIGITSVRFHTLRACFATQLLAKGVAPALVMKIGGWKDFSTMQKYVRLSGIDVQGATKSIDFIPDRDFSGKVIELFQS